MGARVHRTHGGALREVGRGADVLELWRSDHGGDGNAERLRFQPGVWLPKDGGGAGEECEWPPGRHSDVGPEVPQDRWIVHYPACSRLCGVVGHPTHPGRHGLLSSSFVTCKFLTHKDAHAWFVARFARWHARWPGE